jgi:hypothetical protein
VQAGPASWRACDTQYRLDDQPAVAQDSIEGPHAPETNGVVERFSRPLKYEHFYREEIADVIALDDQVRANGELYNWADHTRHSGSCRPSTATSRSRRIARDHSYPDPKASRRLDAVHTSPLPLLTQVPSAFVTTTSTARRSCTQPVGDHTIEGRSRSKYSTSRSASRRSNMS